MKRVYTGILIIVIAVLLSKQESHCQDSLESLPRTLYWGAFGIGGGTKGSAGGFNLTFVHEPHSISLRALATAEFELNGKSPLEAVGDISILYGPTFIGEKTLIRIGAGIGIVKEVRRGSYLYSDSLFFNTDYYREDTRSSIGFPLEMQVFGKVFPVFGFGVYGFANVNSLRSYWGGLITFQFGKLW